MESIEDAAKKAQEIIDKEAADDPKLKNALKIVKKFIQTHPVICYGGTAINSLFQNKTSSIIQKKIFLITIFLQRPLKYILQRLRID